MPLDQTAGSDGRYLKATHGYYSAPHWRRLRSAALTREVIASRWPAAAVGPRGPHRVTRPRQPKLSPADRLDNLRSLCATHDAQIKNARSYRRSRVMALATSTDFPTTSAAARPYQVMDAAARYRHELRLARAGNGPPKPIRRRRTDRQEIGWYGFAAQRGCTHIFASALPLIGLHYLGQRTLLIP